MNAQEQLQKARAEIDHNSKSEELTCTVMLAPLSVLNNLKLSFIYSQAKANMERKLGRTIEQLLFSDKGECPKSIILSANALTNDRLN